MEYLASTGELGESSVSSRLSWPLAIRRALRTAREALDCTREIRRIPLGSDSRQRAALLSESSARLSRSIGLDLAVHGPIPRGPAVIAANHLSYLDPIAIGQTLPVGAVAKSEIMRWPGVGQAAEDLGIVFVRRGCVRSGATALRKAMRLLDAGVSILVFPEGTTSFGRDVLPFSRGAFGMARLMRVPVVPATIRYHSPEVCWVGDDTLVPHALKLHRLDQIGADLFFGPPLEPMAFSDAAKLAKAARQCIRSLLLP
ncbi:MAG: lysophospholipid acyltransferase family protein [Polyangiales bacterium]